MKVSIIVPVYHAEKYIRQCVDSLQKQTYQNIEIILVHTCSGDASGVICDEYGARDARIKIIHTEKAPTEGTSTEALTDRGQILMETASTVPMRRRTERNIRD